MSVRRDERDTDGVLAIPRLSLNPWGSPGMALGFAAQLVRQPRQLRGGGCRRSSRMYRLRTTPSLSASTH